jgi:SAM-dependent methyltransferase
MRPDAADLEAFYDSRQGQLVRRLISREIKNLWPDLAGQRVLGLGFAAPFMAALANTAERVMVIMPPSQGVVHWPPGKPNLVALGQEDDLPLADRSIDRLLIVHGLETTDHLPKMLREVWRVLADGGEVIVVVPNRRGLWCLGEQTPFGHGRPFSSGQLKQLLRNHLFAPQRTGFALFVPPFRSSLLLRTAVAWERIGLRWLQRFAGVVVMMADKRIYVAPADPLPAAERRRAPAYAPAQAGMAAERIGVAERRGEVSRAARLRAGQKSRRGTDG